MLEKRERWKRREEIREYFRIIYATASSRVVTIEVTGKSGTVDERELFCKGF
jgi:hypothetical protein